VSITNDAAGTGFSRRDSAGAVKGRRDLGLKIPQLDAWQLVEQQAGGYQVEGACKVGCLNVVGSFSAVACFVLGAACRRSAKTLMHSIRLVIICI
jgi:hypothetical protein